MPALDVVVSKIIDEGCDARTFRLDLPPGAAFAFVPGQFTLISFPDRPEENRAYSLVSSPLENDHVEITVSRGPGLSERLLALRGGESLRLGGPVGKWIYRDEVRQAALVSEGIGVAPFRSMIRYVLDKGLPNTLSLVYAEKSPECLLYRREFDHYRRRGVAVTTTILGKAPGWDGPKGPITAKLLRSAVKDFETTTYFVCGANRVVDQVRGVLEKARVPDERIVSEKWGDF